MYIKRRTFIVFITIFWLFVAAPEASLLIVSIADDRSAPPTTPRNLYYDYDGSGGPVLNYFSYCGRSRVEFHFWGVEWHRNLGDLARPGRSSIFRLARWRLWKRAPLLDRKLVFVFSECSCRLRRP
ncbi:hypothetical protein GWI33_015995 [Rhynchophorus ferrugineus]|uniref:Uncharacterized protein n=1 Tax=Rhynchophorus ferrugineus TaxID=354439 RepID=A0A834HZM4_RHYFE|nr:hypothetical protein GWI33_015995 [Rhynchophorus ferrugineus]